MGATKQYPENGTNEEKYWYVYEKAKEYGDKFPEITASQFALETAHGSKTAGKNNLFNQTAVGDTLSKRKWMDYKSADESIKERATGKWAKMYAKAPNVISAIAMIQPKYAPTKDKNDGYISGVTKIMKQYDLYKGSTDLPNADVKPQFYQEGRAMNAAGWYSYKQVDVDKHWKSYNDEIAKLDERAKKGEPEGFITQERINTQKKYQDMGLRGHFNNEIDKENRINEEKEKEKNTKVYEGVRMMTEFLSQNDLLEEGTASGQFENKDKIVLNIAGNKKKDLEYILKKNPEYKKYFKQKGNTQNFGYLDTRKPLVLEIPKKDDGKNIFSELKKNANYINPEGKFEVYGKDGVMKEDQWNSWFIGNGVLRTGLITDTRFDIPGTSYTRKLQTNKRQRLEQIPETVVETPVEETAPVNPETATEADLEKIKIDETKRQEANAKAKTIAEAEKVIENNANAFYADEMTAPAAYQDEKFKDPFPFAEILSGAFGVAMGADMANKDIPKRTEQVSDAYRNYTAELSKLSQIGLRPEDEAYAKRMLTESYQHSISTLENQANGNRNIILGNLGRVDLQTQQGMLEIALADSKAKTDAMYKYGEAVKYINEFDATRDIANSEREYDNVLATKKAGGELMGSAFASILENFQNYKDNAPGSVNHAYKSKFYRDSFGIDPSLKDDGKGTVPFTPSYKKIQDQKLVQHAKEFNQTRQDYWSLSPEKRKIADTFLNHNRTSEASGKMISYLKENENPGILDLSKAEQAVASNDYSQMFGSKEVAKIDSGAQSIAANDKTTPTEIAPGPAVPVSATNEIKKPDVYSTIEELKSIGMKAPSDVSKQIVDESMPTNQKVAPVASAAPVTNEQVLNSGNVVSNASSVIASSNSAINRFQTASNELEKYLSESKGNSILDQITEKTEKDTLIMQQQMVAR